MLLLKEVLFSVILTFCLLGYASAMDFSDMDFVHDEVMKYYAGTERTVNVLKPKFEAPPPIKQVKSKRPTGVDRLSLSNKAITPKQKLRLTFIKQKKTYKKRKTPSNKFLEAVYAIERGTADAKAAQKWMRKHKRVNLQATKKALKLAVQNRMFQYARHKLGRALYYTKHDSSRRPKRSTKGQESSFMGDLMRQMGTDKFEEFMAIKGDVTLMFAIDTTGSMSDEIEAAKRIAVDVINYPRENPVSYILSPFNDPNTENVTYKNSSEGALFVDAINNLKAHGGGDCPELTMTAIIDALYEGPTTGSPLYVFTDASAKDDSRTNIEEIKQMAKYVYETTINFFTTESDCYNPSFKSFQELADATSGQVLSLSNHQELQKLTGFTGSVLGGSNVISSGSNMSNRKKRRAAGDHRYSIKVDDSIQKISVCVTTSRPNQGTAISLINPRGVKITSGKTSMSKISVYEMTQPLVGTWTLVIPPSSGTHTYYVKSTSDTNIDFEHFFNQSMPGPVTDVPVSEPLIGKQTKLILTLAGYEKVQKNTTVLELITKHGEHIRDVTLQPYNQGRRYNTTFTSPSRPFKLKIKGTTKTGNSFERVSRNVIEPKHVSMRVMWSDKDFTLERGHMSTVTFHIFNGEARNIMIKISAKDRLGYVLPVRRNRRRVRRNKWAFFRVIFRVPSNAKIGSSDTAMVSVTYKNGAKVLVKPVQLLVVA